MDIDEVLDDARGRLEVVDPPVPAMDTLRRRATRASQRRSAVAMTSLVAIVAVMALFAGTMLLGDPADDVTVIANGGDTESTEFQMVTLEPSTISPEGGSVTLTVTAPEAEWRFFNPMVDVHRREADGWHRLGRLYLDTITGGGPSPEFDPSTTIGYHAPQVQLAPGESNTHELVLPPMEPGSYRIELLVYGQNWLITESVFLALAVEEVSD